MKKQTLYIIITLVVALVLGGLLAVLFFTDPARNPDKEDVSYVEEGGTLISRDAAAMVSLKVKNPSSEFTIVRDPEAEAQDTTGTLHYTFEGYEDMGAKSGTLAAAVENIAALKYTKEIGEVQDVNIYGLDGTYTAVATFEDGSTEELVFGITPGESSGRYVLYKGKVYICAINSLFMIEMEKNLGDVSWTINPYQDNEGNYHNYLNTFVISGKNFENEIEINFDSQYYDYVMTKPVAAVAGTDLMESIAQSLSYVETSGVAAVNPDEAKLAEFGLTEPYCDLNFVLNGNAHRITLGNQSNPGFRYAYLDGDKSVVYTLSDVYYGTWADTTETKLRDGYVYLKMIYDVNKITVEANGKTAVIDLTREVNEELTTEGSVTYDYFAKLDGKEIEYNNNVNVFYTDIIGIPFVNMEEMETEGEPVLTVKYKEYDSEAETVLEFYQAKDQDSRIVAFINGKYSATVRDTSIQDFIASFENFLEKNK